MSHKSGLVLFILVSACPASLAAEEAGDRLIASAFSAADLVGVSGSLVEVNPEALRAAANAGGPSRLGQVALSNGQMIELEAKPMRVVSPDVQIVVGRRGGDEPVAYDHSQVHAFLGKVTGEPGSRVVVVATPRGVRGHIELGGQKHLLNTIASDGNVAGLWLAEVHKVSGATGGIPGVPLCGHEPGSSVQLEPEGGVAGCCPEPAPEWVYHNRLAVVEIALETDNELYQVFNDSTAVIDYLIELIARTNAIFMHDIDTRFDIVFMRIFDDPADEPPFMSNPDPLQGYRNHWNNEMAAVPRDTGAFLSGRRDLPYGGIAYIGAVCFTEFAYCVCGYLNGFPDPTRPNSGDYDLGVVAHELGHNFNACHTPDYCPQMDQCYPPPVVPQRGSMMSYCSQTVSGGNMVTELWYHRRLRRVMRDFVEFSATCLHYDCNDNGIDDLIDLGMPGSDTNGNFILDVCEDCNSNSILDPQDISSGFSQDVNGNGIPDECEPDCNNNGVPDDYDIFLGTSQDLWGNGIPDECDPDCDGNEFPDYNQIQANLSLDIDRNAVLDSCQDCDNDGINDLVALMGARNAWVASDVQNFIAEFHAISGVRVKTSPSGHVSGAQDLIIDGLKVLVSTGSSNKVVVFHAQSGAHLGDFVTAGSGGLTYATGMTIRPNGNLLVCSRNTGAVLEYSGFDGSFIGAFIAAGSGGLNSPFGIVYGPGGNVFVTSGGNQVLEFNGNDGSFVRVFVSLADNGGLSLARGMAFKPDGNLLVASYNTDAVLEYDGGTGAFLGKWNSGGTLDALYLEGPWGIRIGPNGNVFVTRDLPATFSEGGDHNHDHDLDVALTPAPLHVTAARIMEFDVNSGKYLQSYILGDDTGLRSPTGFDFMPGGADCDFNMLPDSCDLADCAGNPDCGDCNTNGVLDSCDIASCDGNPACGDCNGNRVPDGCDIANGTSLDVNPADGIPDECAVTPPAAPSADPSGLAKCRFISFEVPAAATAGVIETALRVRLISLHHVVPPYTGGPSVPFTSFEGQVRWVGPPAQFLESNSSATPFHASELQCAPHYQDWSTVGLLHVTGSAIVPSSQYEVDNVAASCQGQEESCAAISSPLAVGTTRWGDVEVPFNPPDPSTQPNTSDFASLVNKFRGALGAPIKARALLIGSDAFGNLAIGPDVNFVHVAGCVDAFRGLPYPHQIAACP